MASAKEISDRIKSIQDTMKITKAMYMMSSMKLRKARQKLENTEPYFYGLQEQIADILLHFPDMRHLYFDNRGKDLQETVKKKAFIVITGDKGMAGAYNHNVLKEAKRLVDEAEEYRLFVVGELGRQYFTNQGYSIETDFCYSANNPSMHRARVITEHIVELYKQEEIDEVYVIFTRMINSMKEEVEVQEILPLKTHQFIKQELLEKSAKGHGNYDKEAADQADDWFLIYPSPRRVLEKLVYNYVTGFMYGVLVEGSASEENARMMAMQSATDNAQEMLRELSVEYNRVRQAAITQEITEVIGGAKALKKKKMKQAR
ncbi:MAG: ATP synthase F1 subunit gamma [Lachnospiraceae bacterium]